MNKEQLQLKLNQLHDEIRMFEIDRINNYITNTERLKPLYDLYYKLQEQLRI